MDAFLDQAIALHRDAVVIDLHVDTLLWTRRVGYDPNRPHRTRGRGNPFLGQADTPRMLEGGLTAVGLGLVPNPLRRGGRAVDLLHRYLDDLDRWVERSQGRAIKAGCVADIEGAQREGQVALFAGIEGAHGLGGKIEALPDLVERGVRYVGFAHFTRNRACHPSMGWGADPDVGLSGWGKELLSVCDELGVVVDLAHINKKGFLEACASPSPPRVVTHTGLSSVYPSPRNIDDDCLRAVAATGGVVGVIFYPPYLTGKWHCALDAVCEHVEHVAATVGWEAVAIGSDMDGFIPTLADGLADCAQLPMLTAALLRRGHSSDNVRKFLGTNALRAFGAAWDPSLSSEPDADSTPVVDS